MASIPCTFQTAFSSSKPINPRPSLPTFSSKFLGAGIYGSKKRDDFDKDDVEQYFNYMGMLAVEGTYDKMEALLNQNIHPVDILLMLATSEGDKPKIEELLRAGATYDVKDADGRTAIDRDVAACVDMMYSTFHSAYH
ncbi:hypothetical protein V6N13_142352 [Hibiscus sabdariffa]|uniref:Protein LHCP TRANSLOCATION DEFECT n=1 Tax=Hibiscus sabdariffa TaxID=183260 RepID=A0ABR2FDZ6_9ROSI